MREVVIECGECKLKQTFTEDEFKKRIKEFMKPLGTEFVFLLSQFQCINCWRVVDVVIMEEKEIITCELEVLKDG